MRRDERIADLKMARELAGRGHRPQRIEALLSANGYPEAAEFIDQPHIHHELRDIALRAGRREETESAIRESPLRKSIPELVAPLLGLDQVQSLFIVIVNIVKELRAIDHAVHT
ncbi:MAG: hypothetical protein JOZ84_03775 [Methylobacteriaceae bacterium]|nr:hypothetical protein [Methylobacteriaceae bacterium]